MNPSFLISWLFIFNCFSALSQANLWTAFTAPTTMASIPPVYGTQGVSSPFNTPGTRQGAVTWTDHSGNLWLFGGIINGTYGTGGDLWKYNITIHEWVWMHGSNTGNSPAVYVAQGVPSPSNTPGYRLRAEGWIDNTGDLWLYGGYSSMTADDLWKYSMATNEWTWVKGTTNAYAPAVFGTKGIPSVNNSPGARTDFVSGTDASGNLWLFAGYGATSSNSGPMADLWKYDIAINNWTWMNGSQVIASNGNYGQQGVASSNSYPGARWASSGCVDSGGNFWVFGGNGYPQTNYGILNDLWMYNFSSGLWTWAAGSYTANNAGSYGSVGIPSTNNSPPKRYFGTMTADNLGNIWLFGGNDGTLLNSTQTATHSGNYNDLWRFNPSRSEWAWMAGSNTWDQQGVFGTIGTAGPAYTPGARCIHQMWKDNNGGIWIFGGSGGIAALPSSGWYADFWLYGTCNPSTSTLNPIPALSISGSSIICLGEVTTLTVTGNPDYTLSDSSSVNVTTFNTPYAPISPSQTTIYSVSATNANNCSVQTVITISVSTCESIETVKNEGFRVYPNPFKQKITIETQIGVARQINIFNVRGQLVFSNESDLAHQEVDLKDLEPGFYFMRLSTDRNMTPIKLIKDIEK